MNIDVIRISIFLFNALNVFLGKKFQFFSNFIYDKINNGVN